MLRPGWPSIPGVHAIMTTRRFGSGSLPDTRFNLGLGSSDDEHDVASNRATLRTVLHLRRDPCWLDQQHACTVVEAKQPAETMADGTATGEPGVTCAILTADCVPVLLAQREGKRVAALHAGWRGLAAGIIESGMAAMGCAASEVVAWLGPGICGQHYVVGDDVRAAFLNQYGDIADAFVSHADRWRADLHTLTVSILRRAGVVQVYADTHCTHGDAELFFSHRRDGVTGRMASLIWISPDNG